MHSYLAVHINARKKNLFFSSVKISICFIVSWLFQIIYRPSYDYYLVNRSVDNLTESFILVQGRFQAIWKGGTTSIP